MEMFELDIGSMEKHFTLAPKRYLVLIDKAEAFIP